MPAYQGNSHVVATQDPQAYVGWQIRLPAEQVNAMRPVGLAVVCQYGVHFLGTDGTRGAEEFEANGAGGRADSLALAPQRDACVADQCFQSGRALVIIDMVHVVRFIGLRIVVTRRCIQQMRKKISAITRWHR